jgi:hypothetical protein
MNKPSHSLWKMLLILTATFFIVSCSKVTQSNFDKIKPDMTTQEVTSILGEPTSTDTINIAGISGTSAVWQDKNAEINIQFLNNKVTIKVYNKSNNKQPAEVAAKH